MSGAERPFPPGFVGEVRRRTPLRSLIEGTVRLTRSGRTWTGCCPFHAERTPSFHLYPDHYHCFGCGAHGDSIQFVMDRDGSEFVETVLQLAGEAGMAVPNAPPADEERARRKAERLARQRAELQRARDEAAEREDADKLQYLRRRLKRTVPVADTIGARYLAETRGSAPPAGGWADCVRFDPHDCALVMVATNPKGEPRQAQWIHLTADAQKAEPTSTRPTKLTRGPSRDGDVVVRLPGPPGAPLLIAEGPETGLTLHSVAAGCETWICLGGMASLQLPKNREVVICADDDPRHGGAARQLRRGFRRWRREGVTFTVAKPNATRSEDGGDFNDLLRQFGRDAVDERLLIALEPRYRSKEPAPMPIVEQRTRQAIDAECDRIFATPFDKKGPRPVLAIRAGTGTRKTDAAIRNAIVVADKLGVVFLGVPRIDLADEVAERVREALRKAGKEDLTVGVYRGADRDDPLRPGHKICDNGSDRREAEARGLNAAKTVCPTCPVREGCGKLRQKSERHAIWVGAINLVYGTKPAEIGKVNWIILDENSIAAALIGTGELDKDDGPVQLPFDAWQAPPSVPGDPAKTARLADARATALSLLESLQDGRLTRGHLVAAGITSDTAHQARGLEYASTGKPKLDEDMTHEDAMEAIRSIDNRGIKSRAMFWREVENLSRGGDDEISGRIEIVTLPDDQGREVRMKGIRPIGYGWDAPVLIIDATVQETQIRAQHPQARFVDIGHAAAPHRHIRQVIDSSFSLLMLDASAPLLSAKERRRRGNHLRRLHAWVSLEAAKSRAVGKTMLVVAQARIELQLRALGEIVGVAWGHHGALTGVDKHRDVGHVIVIGRVMPKPEHVEAMAEAATGQAVQRLPAGQWYPLVDGWREMADGTLVPCETVRHPDRVAESFRWRACEGELLQLVERGRGARRTADKPLLVTVLTDALLPLPVNEIITLEAVTARAEDMMVVRAGVVLRNAEHAAKVFGGKGGLWANANALRQRLHRERERHGSDWQPLAHLVHVRYRLDLPGSHHEAAYFDTTVIADPAAWLRENLGAVAYEPQIAPLQTPLRETPLLKPVTEPSAPKEADMVLPWWTSRIEGAWHAHGPPDG